MEQLEAFMVTWNLLEDLAGVDVDKGEDIPRGACFNAEPYVRECSLLRSSIGCDACLHFDWLNLRCFAHCHLRSLTSISLELAESSKNDIPAASTESLTAP